jgi:hypothetical protein
MAIYEQKIKQIEEEMLPVGFLDDGQQEELLVESGDIWGNSNESEQKQIPPGYLLSKL